MLAKLSMRLEQITYDMLPKKTIEKAKTAILNYIGGSLPGSGEPAVLAEMRLWEALGAAGPCTVLGHRGSTSLLAAAAINAMMGQVFLQEDCHERSISHPGVVVIPTALALSQYMHLTGKELIAGVVCGYEGLGKIGRCLILPGFPRNGLRPAAWVAPFGSACAAAKLLGMDKDGIRDAISIAANTCSGVMECSISGSDDMCIQNCYSVKNGIMSAFEAQHGLHGARTILEGRFGLGRALNNADCDWGILAENDGFEIDDTFIKIHPGCGHVLPTAQAAVELVRTFRLTPKDVDRAVVGTGSIGKSFPGCDNQGPFAGRISAMMSHQFMVAAALCTGTVNISAVKSFSAPAILDVAKRVEVVVEPEIDQSGRCAGRVTFFLRGGGVVSNFQGNVTPQSEQGVDLRMIRNGSGLYSDLRIKQIISNAHMLEALDDAAEFVSLLEPDINSRIV